MGATRHGRLKRPWPKCRPCGGGRQTVGRHERFVVLSRRWVFERPFSWFGGNQRLAKTLKTLARPRLPSSPSPLSSSPSGGSPGREHLSQALRSLARQLAGSESAAAKTI